MENFRAIDTRLAENSKVLEDMLMQNVEKSNILQKIENLGQKLPYSREPVSKRGN